ncbi:S24/S26 family peptidase [Kytococcus sp. Marseille-QA3725]
MRIGIARVSGRSMEPTVHDGDRLLVVHGLPVRRGRLVVAQLPDGPTGPRPLGVKRVSHRQVVGSEVRWWVTSDNPRAGTDSRVFGALPPDAVVAVVVCRLPRRTSCPRRTSP